jgi:hypothetical protein
MSSGWTDWRGGLWEDEHVSLLRWRKGGRGVEFTEIFQRETLAGYLRQLRGFTASTPDLMVSPRTLAP